MGQQKKPSNKPAVYHRSKMNTAGGNASKKTRADVPSTPANKAASGKQIRAGGGRGGRGRGK